MSRFPYRCMAHFSSTQIARKNTLGSRRTFLYAPGLEPSSTPAPSLCASPREEFDLLNYNLFSPSGLTSAFGKCSFFRLCNRFLFCPFISRFQSLCFSDNKRGHCSSKIARLRIPIIFKIAHSWQAAASEYAGNRLICAGIPARNIRSGKPSPAHPPGEKADRSHFRWR